MIMENKFKYDVFRCYGNYKLTLKQKLTMPYELKYLKYFRKYESSNNNYLRFLYKFIILCISRKSQIQIPVNTTIAKGFYIGHSGRLIINGEVKIGKNVNVATGVTIGQESRGVRKGTPVIGDDVWIGTNSVIVGKVSIGNDVMIAPLTFVNFDVPSHSIVIGNPAKIIKKNNATEGYLLNKIK